MRSLRAVREIHIGLGESWALASAVSYALGNVLTRVVSVGGDPLAGSIIRTLPLMFASLGIMAWRYGGIARLLPRRAGFMGWRGLGVLAFAGLVNTPVSIVALYLAFRYGGVLVAVPIFSINPLWGALIAVPFLGEAFNKLIGGGIVATMIGIALLTYGQHVGTPVSPQWPLGVVYAMLTSLSWGLGANLRRYVLKRGLDVFWLNGITSTAGIVLLTAILAGMGRLDTVFEFSSTQIWQLFSAGGLSAIGNWTLSAAFVLTVVASVTTLKSLDIVIASLLAIFFLGEVLNLPVGLGILIIIAGVLLVQTGMARPSRAVETVSAN
ncbi:MAG: DMT family transporter [Anaerolineae bacterium]